MKANSQLDRVQIHVESSAGPAARKHLVISLLEDVLNKQILDNKLFAGKLPAEIRRGNRTFPAE